METVSVVIPIYNAEKYLKQCIASVLKQEFKHIQVILVDDYSNDDSLNLCKYYEKIDKRVNVLCHQKTLGVSQARNSGLDKAIGKYVMFVDADDIVEQDFIKKMVIGMKCSEIAACGYTKFDGINAAYILPETGEISKELFLYHVLCSNLIGGFCWNKIFRSDLVKGLYFDSSLSIGEDMLFLVKYLSRCQNLYYVSQTFYHYRVNSCSSMQEMYTNHVFDRSKVSNLRSAVKIKKVLANESDNVNKYSSYRIVRTCIWLMYQMMVCREYQEEIGTLIQNYIKKEYSIFKLIDFGIIEQKIFARIIMCSPKIAFYMGCIYFMLFPFKAKKFRS